MKNLKNLSSVKELTVQELKKINGGWVTADPVLSKIYGRPTAIYNGRVIFYNP